MERFAIIQRAGSINGQQERWEMYQNTSFSRLERANNYWGNLIAKSSVADKSFRLIDTWTNEIKEEILR